MIVPIGPFGGSDLAFGEAPGAASSEASQLMAVAALHQAGRLQPQSAEPAPDNHKGYKKNAEKGTA